MTLKSQIFGLDDVDSLAKSPLQNRSMDLSFTTSMLTKRDEIRRRPGMLFDLDNLPFNSQ